MNGPITTEEIIKRLESRDMEMLVYVEKKYTGLMKRIAYNLYLDKYDTEECINDTVLEVWNTIPPNKPESITSYIGMLMRRRVIDKIRYNTAEKRGAPVYYEVLDELTDSMDLENTVVSKVYIAEVLNKFLEKQTPENREIFIRRYYEFESADSIGKDMFINSNTVYKRLQRMKDELKQMLSERG